MTQREVEPTPPREPFQHRITRLLYGDDVFISYSRGDTSEYAFALALAIHARGLTCYLDQFGSQPGREIPPSLKAILLRSSALIVLASPASGASPAVGDEVAWFRDTGRPILVVDLAGGLARAQWRELVSGIAPLADAATDAPSDRVIARIKEGLTFTSRNARLRRATRWTVIGVASLLAAGGIGTEILRRQAKEAVLERAAAEGKQREAQQQAEQAERARAGADGLRRVAEEQQREALTRAERAQALAVAGERFARAMRFVALSESMLARDPEASVLFAAEAVRTSTPTPASVSALRRALEDSFISATLRCGESSVVNALMSRNGQLVATAEEDGTIRVWSIRGQLRGKIITSAYPHRFAFAAEGHHVAVAHRSHLVRWDLSNPPAEVDLADDVVQLRISPSGDDVYFATQGPGSCFGPGCPGSVWLWSSGRSPAPLQLSFAAPRINGAVFSEDAALAAWLDHQADGATVVLTSVASGKQISLEQGTIPPQWRDVQLGFSGDGSRLVAFSAGGGGQPLHVSPADCAAAVWDTTNGSQLRRATTQQDGLPPFIQLEAGETGRLFAVDHDDGSLSLWSIDPHTMARWRFRIAEQRLQGVRFSPDDKLLLIWGYGANARVLDPLTGKELAVLRGHRTPINTAVFDSTGGRVLTAGKDGTARIWDIARVRASSEARVEGLSSIERVDFSRDHTRLVAADTWSIGVFPAAGGQPISLWKHGLGPLHELRFVAHGRIAAVSDDGRALIMDSDGSNPKVLHALGEYPSFATISGEGRTVAWRSPGGPIRLFDVRGGRRELRGYDVRGLKLSPDGRRLALLTKVSRPVIWEWATNRILELAGHDQTVAAAVFSDDGRRLATGSGDHTARIWDLPEQIATRSLRATSVLRGHESDVVAVSFGVGDRQVITADASGSVHVFDAHTGDSIQTLLPHQGSIVAASALSDQRFVVLRSNGTFRVDDCDLCGGWQKLLELVSKRTSRVLEAEELR